MTDEGSATNGGLAGMKRPAQDDNNSFATTEKRPLVMDKVAAAAEAAARINQKLGGSQPPANPTPNPTNANTNAARIITTETAIPDRYVGLAGTPERTVTLTGTPQQIDHAKQLISDIIERADKNGPVQPNTYTPGAGNMTTIELMIPGLKAGLVIGKNGETIKNLQEENGVKMVLIQQNNSPTPEDKPLRISGEASRVEKARQAVLSLVNARDVRGFAGYHNNLQRPGGHAPYGCEGYEATQYAVPAEKAGLVIGKGGESIKEICRVSGAHVEISKDPPPDQSIKIFHVRGNRSEIEQAIRMISDRAGIPMTRPVTTTGAAPGPWGQYGYPQADPWGLSMANGSSQCAVAAAMPPPTYNPYTGQPDYSAAWAEYYRRQGMHECADAILRQAQQPSAPSVQPGAPTPASHIPSAQPSAPAVPTAATPAAAPTAAPVPVQSQTGAPGQYDYNQWQQWQQWQAWQQAWQQQQQQPCAPVQPGAPSGPPMPAAPAMPVGHGMQGASGMPPAPAPGHPPMPQ